MGSGFNYKCSKCGKEYSGFLGIGMLFPRDYEKTLKEAKKGKYGPEWKSLISKEDMVAIDAENRVYSCSKCNSWKVEKGLSIYRPLTEKALQDVERGYVIIGQDSGLPYLEPVKFSDSFQLIKHYIHKCDKCGSRMHKASNKEIDNLPCPYCGGERDKTVDSLIMWD